MIYILFGILVMIGLGGILIYALNEAVEATGDVMVTLYPALASDYGYLFIRQNWHWMPLTLLIALLIWAVVNSQREREVRL